MTQNSNRSDSDALESDPSAELGLRSPVRDKERLGDEQYNATPPREAVRPPDSPPGTEHCTQCSAPLDRSRAVRSDAKEYDYFFCDVTCRDRWHHGQRCALPRATTPDPVAMRDLVAVAPPWMLALGSVLVMLVVGFLVHAILFAIAARIARRTVRPLDGLFVQYSRRPARLLIPLAFAMVAWRSVPRDAAWAVSGERLLGMLFIVGIAWLLIAMTQVLADWVALRFPVDVVENLQARRIRTQAQIFRRTASTIIAGLAIALILLKIPGVENVGASLLASAGIAGIVVGMAARPALSNLLAGLQLALTQPIRLDDVVIVEGEWGRIEEITNTYVVVKIWDLRRLVVPLSHFIEHPFQNWTRSTSKVLGTVFVSVDYTMPIEPVREALHRILQSSPLWDGEVWNLQVVESTDRTLQLRCLMSASDAGRAWDLRCHVREQLVRYLCETHSTHLPKTRTDIQMDERSARHPPLVERSTVEAHAAQAR